VLPGLLASLFIMNKNPIGQYVCIHGKFGQDNLLLENRIDFSCIISVKLLFF